MHLQLETRIKKGMLITNLNRVTEVAPLKGEEAEVDGGTTS